LTITGDDRGVVFDPAQVPADETATGSESIDGPAADGEISNTVTVVYGQGQSGAATATITVPACTGTPAPPDIVFTFTNDPSVATAEVGETVDYFYCGENTSDVELEVVRVVDDRFGILEVPEESTVVSPGERLCNTDLGLPVSYQTVDSDAGTTIVNNAVVTVRTDDGQEFQAADPAEVEVFAFGVTGDQSTTTVEGPTTTVTAEPIPDTGVDTNTELVIAAVMLTSGWLLVLITRKRRTS
jgi:LPXTG-motif cell wall-anchored protein